MYPELRQISRFELLRFFRFEFLVFSWESEDIYVSSQSLRILCDLRFGVTSLRALCGRSPRPLRFKMWLVSVPSPIYAGSHCF
jgi:hypothetical protein